MKDLNLGRTTNMLEKIKKSSAPGRIQTHRLRILLCMRVLYHCATNSSRNILVGTSLKSNLVAVELAFSSSFHILQRSSDDHHDCLLFGHKEIVVVPALGNTVRSKHIKNDLAYSKHIKNDLAYSPFRTHTWAMNKA